MKLCVWYCSVLLLLFGCKKCELDCKNGGECMDNQCECPTPFSGETCEFNLNEIFAGNFSVTSESCNITSNPEQYEFEILFQADTFLVKNFSNYNYELTAVLRNDSLVIVPFEDSTYSFNGNFIMSTETEIKVTSYITTGSRTDSCIYFAQKLN